MTTEPYAESARLCGLLIDSYEGCYCELPAGHDAYHECACGARHIGYPELNAANALAEALRESTSPGPAAARRWKALSGWDVLAAQPDGTTDA